MFKCDAFAFGDEYPIEWDFKALLLDQIVKCMESMVYNLPCANEVYID